MLTSVGSFGKKYKLENPDSALKRHNDSILTEFQFNSIQTEGRMSFTNPGIRKILSRSMDVMPTSKSPETIYESSSSSSVSSSDDLDFSK